MDTILHALRGWFKAITRQYNIRAKMDTILHALRGLFKAIARQV